MNVLQVLPELNVGGVETGTIDLARALIKEGHKAVVVSNGGKLLEELKACGGIHYQLPVHKKSLLAMMKMVPRLVEIIRTEEIDIVHARSRVPALIAYFAARLSRRTFVTTCHGYYRRHLFSRVMGWGKRVIVISNAIGRHMVDDFGVPYERIRLIPRSVDPQRFHFTPPKEKRGKEFNVGIIGRITPIKGHLHFIKAMAIASRSIPRLKIWVVGDAPLARESYKEQVKSLARRLGLWQNTEFLGTQRDIPQILSHFDCLVMATTTQEAFGRVIIEAQAAGVPVVATRVGGVVDIIEHEKTGLLVPAADPRSIAEAVVRLYLDEPLASALAANAYQKVRQQFTVEKMVKSTIETYQEALSQFKILIIKISSLGDVVLSTAAIQAIRQKFPSPCRITVLVGEESKDVLLRCPHADEVQVCDFKNKDRGLTGLLRLGASLRREQFDCVIDLQNNRKSHLLAALSLAPQRYGYDNGKFSFLLNHKIKDDRKPLLPLQHQFRVLKMLGIENTVPGLQMWPDEEDCRYAQELLDSQWVSANARIVGFNISASQRWESKNWPLAHIARLCDDLAQKDVRVVVTGTEKDQEAARQLSGMVKNAKLINACGRTTVNQLACLIKKCNVYISGDSASLHIASAMGVPFVALFGPTDPRRHMPPAERYVLLRKALRCSPCYRGGCSRKPRCMELISPKEVLGAVEKLLSG